MKKELEIDFDKLQAELERKPRTQRSQPHQSFISPKTQAYLEIAYDNLVAETVEWSKNVLLSQDIHVFDEEIVDPILTAGYFILISELVALTSCPLDRVLVTSK